ncbi:MAG: TRAP transporter small permease subunit [Cohaesibacteraceae bacterium]|nr:TRAP transporter small permease subunit [Cohaesibacteraceae bacterium]
MSASTESQFVISDPGEPYRNSPYPGDRWMIRFGNIAAWLFPILMAAIVTQVIIRKAGFNQAWLDDIQWWMYGFAMLSGFGYAITTDSHVRVDILHQYYSKDKKARIEIFGTGWLLLPFLVMMTDIMTHYSWASIKAFEGSDSPNGLHMLFLLKTSLPLLFLLAVMACWAVVKRNLSILVTPAFWKMLLAAFPAAWFVSERLVYYVMWWFTRFNQPDLHPRRISKEALLQESTIIGLVLLIIIIGIAYAKSRKSLKA